MAIFCPQCGEKIEDGQVKCGFCGKDVSNLLAGNPAMQYVSQNNSQNPVDSQSNSQINADNPYGSQSTVNQSTVNQSTVNQSTVDQSTIDQYSTQGTDNQYSQTTANPYAGQTAANPYTGQNTGYSYGNSQNNSSTYTAYQPTMTPPTVPVSQGANGLQITGLVLGIISIVICCCPYGGIVLAIAGLICSIIGNQENKHGVGIAGLVCSIIGIVFGVLLILLNWIGEGMLGYLRY